MQQKFFIQPFAFAGDKTAIPDPVQPSGVVSFNQGYGFDYQRELGVDPDAKSIERNQMNWLFGAITEQLAQYQKESAPEFITSADNGGAPFPYARGVMVRYRTGVNPFITYISKVDANTTTPTEGADSTEWQRLVIEKSTNAQALAGTNDTTIMTPVRVAEAIAAAAVTVPAASETVAGIAEIATTAEVNAGTDNTRIITPAKLAAYVPAASTTVIGKTRLATNAEAIAGALSNVAVTPAGLSAALAGQTVPSATETVAGIAEIATTAEVTAGTDDARIVTPLKLAQAVPAASTTVIGKSRMATTAETSAMSLATVSVTPASLASIMATKANLASPTFTGTPDAPTAAPGTNTTQLATTAFVFAGLALKANLASPAFTGVPTAPTAAAGTNTTQLATTAYVRANDDPAKANLAGAAFTGSVSIVGNLTASGFIQKTSSRLIKRDLRQLPYGLAHIEQIETAIGRYVEDLDPEGREHLFVIAEQLAEVVPTVVNREGSEHGGAKIPTVDYTELVPVLIEAVKELAKRLRKLEG